MVLTGVGAIAVTLLVRGPITLWWSAFYALSAVVGLLMPMIGITGGLPATGALWVAHGPDGFTEARLGGLVVAASCTGVFLIASKRPTTYGTTNALMPVVAGGVIGAAAGGLLAGSRIADGCGQILLLALLTWAIIRLTRRARTG